MATPENRTVPGWAHQERPSDLAWIRANLDLLWLAAFLAYGDIGRGAVVVDQSLNRSGQFYVFGYLAQAAIEQEADDDARRLVREYDPDEEIVVILLKRGDRTSAYRIRPQQISDDALFA